MKKPVVLTIFGITSDLASKKILHSFYSLYKNKQLPKQFTIIGTSRKNWTDTQLKEYILQTLKISPSKNTEFLKLFRFLPVDIQDLTSLKELKKEIDKICASLSKRPIRLFYLALPPKLYPLTLNNLAQAEILKQETSNPKIRLALEKPFGQDMSSVKKTEEELQKHLTEKQIFRIDHYLAKQMLENVIAFRFSNSLFQHNWNSKSIEKIEIKMLENSSVPNSFYDKIGALRDVGQNHVLQMMTIATMAQPKNYSAKELRQSRCKLIKFLKPLTPKQVKKNTFRAQFNGYQKIKGIKKNSNTETYFKIRTQLNLKQWKNTIISLESGKNLARVQKEINIYFRHPHPCLCPIDGHYNNQMSFLLEPKSKQGIKICFYAKKPGLKWQMKKEILKVHLPTTKDSLDEYGQLFFDFINADQTLFVTSEEVKSSWAFINSILKQWGKNAVVLEKYQPKTNSILKKANDMLGL